MSGVIEALHIYDEHKYVLPFIPDIQELQTNHSYSNPILSHTYTGRPLPAAQVLPLYLEQPPPRPNVTYLPNANPPTLLFSLTHANLLFLVASSSEIEPLLVLEFLHRVVDAFEEFLGAPLLSSKIEYSYDVVAQLLTEMCDAGSINTTEPNALRDVVEVEGWVDKLLGSINLPGKPAGLGSGAPSSLITANAPALPWRRANVRHTNNELYADVVESLSVTLAPSGRPLAAFANGTIAFTAKISGVPDIIMSLTSPSGKHNIGSIMDLPVFHPCVRLQRWSERPGELSFIPPDGRFILAGYEVDLLPFTNGKVGSLSTNSLKLPVQIEIRTGLGATASDFDVRLQVNRAYAMGTGAGSGAGVGGRALPSKQGTAAAPLLEDVVVRVPLPPEVRNLPEIRPSKGDATFNPNERVLEWIIPPKELSSGSSHFALRCTVIGQVRHHDDEDEEDNPIMDYGYEEPYQSTAIPASKPVDLVGTTGDVEKDAKKMAQNKILMPSSASVSFAVKGWLASGLKVESIMLDPRKSKGLGENTKPYKGVKYLTVSKGGVEVRC
jgi:AP-3 complex subunit mu